MVEGNTIAARSTTSESIFVGNLPDGIDADFLKTNFSNVLNYDITHVNLINDRVTGVFKNIAYINVGSYENVQKAIRLLNNSKVNDKHILVSMAMRPFVVSLEKSIFLRNIPEGTNSANLYDILKPFGDLISIKLPYSETAQKFLHYAFASFVNEESATQAIQVINNAGPNAGGLVAAQFVPRALRVRDWRTVYVKNFPETWSDEFLSKVMSRYGEVDTVYIQKDKEGKSLKFGYVTYKTHEDAVKAVEGNGKIIAVDGSDEGIQLYISQHQTRKERDFHLDKLRKQRAIEKSLQFKGRNVYVKNLSPYMTEEQFVTLFAPFGKIVSAKIQPSSTDPTLGSGVGFVLYESPEAAQAAIRERKQYLLEGKQLYVALFQSKADREAVKAWQMKNPQAQHQRGGRGPARPQHRAPSNEALALKQQLNIDAMKTPDEVKQAIGNFLYNKYNNQPDYLADRNLLPSILGVLLGSLEIDDLLETAVNDAQFRNYAGDAKKMLMEQAAAQQQVQHS